MLRIVFTFLFIAAIDIYFFQAVKVLAGSTTPLVRNSIYGLYWTLSIFSIGFLSFLMFNPSFESSRFVKLYLLSFVFITIISKILGSVFLLIDDVSRGVQWVAQQFNSNSPVFSLSRKQFLSQMTIIVSAIPFTSLIYGMVKTAFNYKVRNVKVSLPNLPANFDGLKILQISDLHTGSFASVTPIKKAIELIAKQNADIIFFTGDLVNSKADEAEKFKPLLSSLEAPLGVYSVLGNHDYGEYEEWPSEEDKKNNFQQLLDTHKEMGWKLLRNENHILKRGGEELAVIGVENWGASMHFPKYGDLEKAKKGTENVPVKLLLSHDPSHWDAQVNKDHQDIDVTFSGHTHGFQFGIEIPGFKWSPVQYVYKQWAGLYQKGKQYIYVNRGLGFLGYLGRVGILPEITVVELSKK